MDYRIYCPVGIINVDVTVFAAVNNDDFPGVLFRLVYFFYQLDFKLFENLMPSGCRIENSPGI